MITDYDTENTPFQEGKKISLEVLGKPDRSRKGDVDEAAWPLIQTINSLPDYYTTSSCAGRINIFKEPIDGKKRNGEWLYVTHDEASVEEAEKTLISLPEEETIWIRMEAPIFHIACRNLEAADKLLKLCQANGWKRSGIISTGGKRQTKKRIMIELVGNERIDVPIASEGKLFFDKRFIKFTIDKANEKLRITRKLLEELRILIEEHLSEK